MARLILFFMFLLVPASAKAIEALHVGQEAPSFSLLDLPRGPALAHMLLLKGRTADARRAFETLREDYPQEHWGEWGMSIVALAEGETEKALGHLRAARAGGWSIPEAETAVMRFLEQYWRTNRQAPGEEKFLALFQEMGSIRACYRRLNQKG